MERKGFLESQKGWDWLERAAAFVTLILAALAVFGWVSSPSGSGLLSALWKWGLLALALALVGLIAWRDFLRRWLETRASGKRSDELAQRAKGMRALLLRPYPEMAEGSYNTSLKTAFNKFLAEKLFFADPDESGKLGWRSYLDSWPGMGHYNRFCELTENLDHPVREGEYKTIREEFLLAIDQLLRLNKKFVQRHQQLQGSLPMPQDWHRDFVKNRLGPFMTQVISFERRLEVETREHSRVLELQMHEFQ